MLDAILALMLTTALLLGSPGPAPLALAATGASGGVKAGLPFLIGILLGLLVAITLAATGVAGFLVEQPKLSEILKWLAAAYLLYVAYKIASNRSSLSAQSTSLPSFKDGFILNLLNPKAYAACIAIFSSVTIPASSTLISASIAAVVCFAVAVFVDSLWLVFGAVIHRFLEDDKKLLLVRWGFAASLVLLVLAALIRG
ncbi:LysE family translocator (plasmid) [Pseudoalteromonas sp. T1lg65]|uniref:LysE family translocator n=1 Tax=Pseudoalteromonas sp. T1lg65 TaxID=2077101 RepID=UPI003F7925FD